MKDFIIVSVFIAAYAITEIQDTMKKLILLLVIIFTSCTMEGTHPEYLAEAHTEEVPCEKTIPYYFSIDQFGNEVPEDIKEQTRKAAQNASDQTVLSFLEYDEAPQSGTYLKIKYNPFSVSSNTGMQEGENTMGVSGGYNTCVIMYAFLNSVGLEYEEEKVKNCSDVISQEDVLVIKELNCAD